MSLAQWTFEARALRRKEDESFKLVQEVFLHAHKVFRNDLISLLGLSIGAGKADEDKPDSTPFIPLNLYCGRPEVMEQLSELDGKEQAATSATKDKSIDALSDLILNMEEGDLEPIISRKKDPLDYVTNDAAQSLMRDMGIEISDPSSFLEDLE